MARIGFRFLGFKIDVDKVCKYILTQPEHHRKVTFAEEYDEFLKHYQKTLKWDIR